MTTKDAPLHELIADLRVRFRSGNSVPVERAHITADEFRRICEGFANWSTIKPAPYPIRDPA